MSSLRGNYIQALGSNRRRQRGGFVNRSSAGGGGPPMQGSRIPASIGSLGGTSRMRSWGIPAPPEIDRGVLPVRFQEKEEIKKLNDRFVSFIEKVGILEQQNKVLEAQWLLLKDRDTRVSKMEPSVLFQKQIHGLQQQLDALERDKEQRQGDLRLMQGLVEDFKNKYEEDALRRNKAENAFVAVKQEFDGCCLVKEELAVKLSGLKNEINFLRGFVEKELRDLELQIKDTLVCVRVDTSHSIDVEGIISDVRAQYELIAVKRQAEANEFYKKKYNVLSLSAAQTDQEIHRNKNEVKDLLCRIQRVGAESDALKKRHASLEAAVEGAAGRGEFSVREAKEDIARLEEELHKARRQMAKHVHSYQELVNVKLSLDIEIAAYRRLLEGEESRVGCVTSRTQHFSHGFGTDLVNKGHCGGVRVKLNFEKGIDFYKHPKKTVEIRTIETRNGRIVSENSEFIH